MSTLETELLRTEREGWAALSAGKGGSYYRSHLTDDALMVLPIGVMDHDTAISAMESAPPWSSFEITDHRAVALTPDSGVLTYRVTARRDGQPPYEALIGSTFVRRGGSWQLAFHQQTPT